MKFSKGKGKVLHLQRSNPRHLCILGAKQMESSFAEKGLGVLLNKLSVSQQYALVTEESNSILSSIRKSIASSSKMVSLPVLLRTGETQRECWILSQASQYRKDIDVFSSIFSFFKSFFYQGIKHSFGISPLLINYLHSFAISNYQTMTSPKCVMLAAVTSIIRLH